MLKRFFGTTAVQMPLDRIRNIGIVAHIDSGKTTTTERMLYYVGYTNRIGNVDEGSTVTDYLKIERERGITIQSACIPMAWKNHRINLIDTPGHVDFTIEVERSLRVLDGAVTVLDGVAGVEAQTETVWRQANNYKIPRIIYVNKMDRNGAAFSKCLKSIEKRLAGWGKPLVCQLPVFEEHGFSTTQDGKLSNFAGILDLITMEHLDWKTDTKTGSIVSRQPIVHPDLIQEASKARENLIEALSDIDDDIVDKFMEADGNHSKVLPVDLKNSLRKCTLNGTGIPVFCGSSFKNMGVQPLLDAVIDYLPSPADCPEPVGQMNNENVNVKKEDDRLCALAFKVIFDQKRGPLTFVRVYSGILEARTVLQVPRPAGPIKERVGKLLEIYADDYEEVPSIQTGNIGIIVGLKNVKTGDTLLSSQDKRLLELHKITIPPPVFVRSIQVDSVSEEKQLEAALEHLLLEDPSLVLTKNEETGQTLLSGMGQLHLEIAGERLQEVYKVEAKLGKVEISYRETVQEGTSLEKLFEYDRELMKKHLKCDIHLLLSKPENGGTKIDTSISRVYQGENKTQELSLGSSYPNLKDIQAAIAEGINNALLMGPKLGYPLTDIAVKCEKLYCYSAAQSTLAAIRAAAYKCTQELLKDAEAELLQPVMSLKIRSPPAHVGAITRDLSGIRKGIVSEIESEDDRTVINCTAPLAELVGYASSLRGMTQGTGEVDMKLAGYEVVPQGQAEIIIKNVRGY